MSLVSGSFPIAGKITIFVIITFKYTALDYNNASLPQEGGQT